MTWPTPLRDRIIRAARLSRCRSLIPAALVAILMGLGAASCTPSPGLDPSQFTSCDSLEEQDAVQMALTVLANAGEGFTQYSGNTPPNIAGTYKITSSNVTYTDQGPANTILKDGRATFVNQTSSNTIQWAATQGSTTAASSLRGYIHGTSAGFTVCLFVEVGVGDNITQSYGCRTQNALFYSLTPSADGQTLTGTFLNVTLAILTGDCSSVGAFSFGEITLEKIDPDMPEIEFIRTISTGNAAATSVVMSPDGSFGFVATSGGQVLRFATSAGNATVVTLPQPNGITSIGPLGMSGAGGAAGFVTGGQNLCLSYSTGAVPALQANILSPTSPSAGTFLPIAPLYDPAAQIGFAGVSFQLQRPGVGVFNPVNGPNPGSLAQVVSFTQTDLLNLAISPSAGQIAGALRGAAPLGRARFLGLINVNSLSLAEEIDIGSALLDDFRADVLTYSGDGSRVYVTTDALVVAAQTSGQFALGFTDVRDNAADSVRHLAASADGEVVCAVIQAGADRTNLSVLDAGNLSELHAAAVPGFSLSGSGGFAGFFGGTRILVVEDGSGHVTPASTELPFKSGATLNAYNGFSTGATAFGVGGRVLAVCNPVERAIYLFQLVNP